MSRPGRPIYMDHNATTPVLPEVVQAMVPFLGERFGNPSSAHAYGREAAGAVQEARERIASLIGASDAEEIVFTSGATESNNLALAGAARAAGGGRRHLVTCAVEHESVLETCAALGKEGFEITVLPVDRHGLVDPGRVERAITGRTLLVSIMMANNEIGTIEPIEPIGAICRRKGVLLHTDAVQAAGRIPVDADALHVDLLSITAHKMYGPKGVGALFVRTRTPLAPLVRGGGQERKLRSGTLNVPAIVGFGAAAVAARRDMQIESAREILLRDRLWGALSARIGRIALNGHPERRLPGNLNVAFDGVEAEALLTALRDVAALSSGSACASGGSEGSYVIRATSGGGPASAARSSIRFGIGRGNTQEEIDRVADALNLQVERLRAMAPPAATRGGGPRTQRTIMTMRRNG